MQKWLSPLFGFEVTSPMMSLKGKPCSLHDFYALRDTLKEMVGICPVKTVCPIQEWLLSSVSCLQFFPWMNIYSCLVFVMLSRLFIAAVWSPAGKGLTS